MDTEMNETKIFKNRKEFDMRDDEFVNGVSSTFAKEHPDWQQQNASNEACWNCYECERCTNCDRCEYSTDCTGLVRMTHKVGLTHVELLKY